MITKTRKQALEAGERQYYTGKPCLHGHLTFRVTLTGACKLCLKSAIARYKKKINENARKASLWFVPITITAPSAATPLIREFEGMLMRRELYEKALSGNDPIELLAAYARQLNQWVDEQVTVNYSTATTERENNK